MRNVSKGWWTIVAATGVFALTCGASVTLETVSAEGKPAAAKTAKTAKTDVKAAAGDAVKRGEYLVTTQACNDCHTPFKMGPKGPEPDMTRMLSGHPAGQKVSPPPRFNADWQWAGIGGMTAFAGPWGVSFTANLTPDKETGLGNWTEEMFMSAIRTGKHAGVGRAILPPMPWPWYGKMTDADLKAMFAYLQTIKPIKNAVPSPVPPSGAPAPPATRE
jgi:mono/diheme cytochrome c family protein